MREEDLQHGAIPVSPITRKLHKVFIRKSVGRGMGFDWSTGYDVRNVIGSITIKNQGSNYSCGGQAGSYFLEVQRRLQNKQEGALSAKSVYSPIAYPGGGTTVSRLMQQIGTAGANLEVDVPSYYPTGAPLSEASMIDESWETDSLTQDALIRAGYTPLDIGEDIEEVAQTIQTYGAVILEITGQNNGTWTTAFPIPPSKTNPNPLWHHFMCAIGAKMIKGKKYIVCLQSMGTTWGENGIQYISEDYFNSGYIVDAFGMVYDLELVPNSDNHSWQAEVARWFKIFLKQYS